ncbi:acyloxyacyl hydrolase [Aequorivita flava]|uniref:Acyloxyacyl hydrolase n=1 Tax=Aequorivita flava TaxID=3114371 RepID=A0AB35YUJ8_9FLAO
MIKTLYFRFNGNFALHLSCFRFKVASCCCILLFCTLSVVGQTDANWLDHSLFFNTELLLGETQEANFGFPSTKTQKQIIFNIGRDQSKNPQEWSQRLKGPKTGYSFGITDFGNRDSLGLAFSFMPFIRFNAFRSERISVLASLGTSFFTEKYEAKKNPRNQAVTTDITWACRLFFYYRLFTTDYINMHLGFGYAHHSNGHMRLHNKGYNSYLLSLSTDIKSMPEAELETAEVVFPALKNSVYTYFDLRAGLGQNSFALAFNEKKQVYTVAGEYGRVYNNTLKVGLGFYFRLYEHYYDYINENEWLVRNGQEYAYFKSLPVYYATNLGVLVSGEVLMNHVSVNLQIGINLHKPAYKMEWRINKGWENTPREIPEGWVLGNFDGFYKFKEFISGRLGLKYYIIGTKLRPKNNLYIAAHINSNLGQADFSEISLGYVRSFNFR